MLFRKNNINEISQYRFFPVEINKLVAYYLVRSSLGCDARWKSYTYTYHMQVRF
jgi:hypothetical protein